MGCPNGGLYNCEDDLILVRSPSQWEVYILAFLFGLILAAFIYIGMVICTALYLWTCQLLYRCCRQGQYDDQDPEDPEDRPEAPVVYTPGNVDRRSAGTRNVTSESETILLKPPTDTVTIRILPAQSCSTNKDKKQAKVEARVEFRSKAGAEVHAKASAKAGKEVHAKAKAKARLENYPEACEKVRAKAAIEGQPGAGTMVRAKSSAEDQSGVCTKVKAKAKAIVKPQATEGHRDARMGIGANTYAETNDQVETEYSTCDPLFSALALLGEDTVTSYNPAYLSNNFIPSAPHEENQQPPSDNPLAAMFNVFETLSTPFSRRYGNNNNNNNNNNNPDRYGNVEYTRNLESYPFKN